VVDLNVTLGKPRGRETSMTENHAPVAARVADRPVGRVLVVDCDRTTAGALRYGGHEIKTVAGWKRAGSLLRRGHFVAVIIDPGGGDDAGRTIHELRLRTDLPIIAIGHRTDETHAVAVFDAGADDYLPRPVGSEELLAHLRARLRRTTSARDEPPVVTSAFTIHLADRRLVLADGDEPALSPLEWRVTEILVRRARHLVPLDDVLLALWGSEGLHKGYHLRSLMSGIRRKAEPEPAHPQYFITIAGLGVKFEPDGIAS
jgi:two-component system KDP operon response regulator KdpE